MEKPITKQRPILLTAFLGFMIAFNIIQISAGWTALDKAQYLHPASTLFLVLAAKNIVYIICCIALIQWKRWGFWGICGIGVLALGTNLLIGGDTWGFVEYTMEVGILYFLLKSGGDENPWNQLI